VTPELDEHGHLNLPEGREYTHRAHRFPGKFHPPLVKHILQQHPEHDVVADPMCGSGTVGVEAAISGRDALCVDLDPLSCLMSRAKPYPVESSELVAVGEQILESAAPFPEDGDFEDDQETARSDIKENLKGTQYAVPYNLFHWFEPYVAVGFAEVLHATSDLLQSESKPMTDAVHTALSASVRRLSRADPQPVSGLEVTKVRREELEAGIDFDIGGTIGETVHRLADGYEELPTGSDLGTVDVVEGNAKSLASIVTDLDLSPSMIVTSPPYCNAIEYSRRHRLEYEWLGLFNGDDVGDHREERIETSRDFFGSRTVRQETLRQLERVPCDAVKTLTDGLEDDGHERKANLLRKYFVDAQDWLEAIYRTLPEDGLFCLVVGPSTSYDRTVDTPGYLEEIAENIGFSIVEQHQYNLRDNKMQYPTDGATTDCEHLIKMRL